MAVRVGVPIGESSNTGTAGADLVGCTRLRGAGAGFRCTCRDLGLKLPESATGVASVSARAGGPGGVSWCCGGDCGGESGAIAGSGTFVSAFVGVVIGASCGCSS